MKSRNIRIAGAAAALVLVTVAVLKLLNLGSPVTGAVDVRFAGFSNGQPSAFTSALPAHYAGFIREWLASGTNVALFTVTNARTRRLRLYPYAGFFQQTNAVRSHYETMLPAAGSAHGILLRPGETATVEVAILPHQGRGFVRFGCLPDYRHAFPSVMEELRVLITTRKRAAYQNEWIYSEQIIP